MPPCFSGSILVFSGTPAPPSLFLICPEAYLICPWVLSGVRSSPCSGDFGRSFCRSVMCGSCRDSSPDDVQSSSETAYLTAQAHRRRLLGKRKPQALERRQQFATHLIASA